MGWLESIKITRVNFVIFCFEPHRIFVMRLCIHCLWSTLVKNAKQSKDHFVQIQNADGARSGYKQSQRVHFLPNIGLFSCYMLTKRQYTTYVRRVLERERSCTPKAPLNQCDFAYSRVVAELHPLQECPGLLACCTCFHGTPWIGTIQHTNNE